MKIFSLTLVFLFFVSSEIFAAEFKFGWIDMQYALTNVTEGKRILKKLEKEVEENKKNLEKEEKDFQKLKEDFEKKSLVMNEQTKKDKQMELQSKFMKIQEMYAKYQQELQAKQGEASQDIVKKIAEFVDDYGKKNAYKAIFEKNALIYKLEGDDITKLIIGLYNEKYK